MNGNGNGPPREASPQFIARARAIEFFKFLQPEEAVTAFCLLIGQMYRGEPRWLAVDSPRMGVHLMLFRLHERGFRFKGVRFGSAGAGSLEPLEEFDTRCGTPPEALEAPLAELIPSALRYLEDKGHQGLPTPREEIDLLREMLDLERNEKGAVEDEIELHMQAAEDGGLIN